MSEYVFPSGTVLIGSVWSPPDGTTLVRGAGIGVTILRKGPPFAGRMINSTVPNCTFRDFTIDGIDSNEPNDSGLIINGEGNTVDTIEVKNIPHLG
jgi:hypothetical protein